MVDPGPKQQILLEVKSSKWHSTYREVYSLMKKKRKAEKRSAKLKVRPAVALLFSS